VMQDFINDIKAAMRLSGLRFPAPESLQMDLPDGLNWSLS
jgi:hypothetical protein